MSSAAEFEAVLRIAQAGQFSDAISLCRKILSGDAQNASAWHLMGACLLKLGKPDEAATSICKAVELKPCTALYLSNLGAAKLELGQVHQAVRYFRDAVELQPMIAI